MLFTRTYRYRVQKPIDTVKDQLLGQHVRIHQLDFEISERDGVLKIIPHAENIEGLRTLPITHLEFEGRGQEQTRVKITAKMRRIDKGGPLLIIIFCLFLVIAALILGIYGKEGFMPYVLVMGGLALVIFAVFWIRMESGYFDYVRKIRDFVRMQFA